MTGKRLTKNLAAYLEPLFDQPVYTFDQNAKRDLPCLVVGYESDNQTAEGMTGHYTVNGFVMVGVNGYDDEGNTLADSLADEAIEALCDREALAAAMNYSEPDERPANNCHLIRLYVRGSEREEQDSSTFVFVRFEAFTASFDSAE